MSTILIVDDLAVFREPVAAALRLMGYETICAANGYEALMAVHNHRPDLVLLDLAMPVFDGLAFLRELRSEPKHANLPVILLTAIIERDKIVQAGKLGVRDYLLKKGFSFDELHARMANLLNQKKPGNYETVAQIQSSLKDLDGGG